jgi:hypothetical protein
MRRAWAALHRLPAWLASRGRFLCSLTMIMVGLY